MKRGRKSVAEQATPPAVISERRPEPPADLPDAAAALWQRTVGTKPADWWRPDTYPLLRSYVLHAARAQVLDQQINEMQPEWLKQADGLDRMDKLLRMRERESRAMTALARSMRLTQQSQIQPRTAGRAHRDAPESERRPWDV